MFKAIDKAENRNPRKNVDFTVNYTLPKGKAEKKSCYSFDDVRVHYNADKLVQFQTNNYNQRNSGYPKQGVEKYHNDRLDNLAYPKNIDIKQPDSVQKTDNKNIVQCMDLGITDDPNNSSQLVPGANIDMNTSVVAFIKLGGSMTFGHAAVVLEHNYGGVLTNFVIDLTYETEEDGTEKCYIQMGAYPESANEIRTGRQWKTIDPVQSNNKYVISHDTGELILEQTACIAAEVNNKANLIKYQFIKFTSDESTMNCASFVELLAQKTAEAAQIVHTDDYLKLGNVRAADIRFAGVKTPFAAAGL